MSMTKKLGSLGEELHDGINAFSALPPFDESIAFHSVHFLETLSFVLRTDKLFRVPERNRNTKHEMFRMVKKR